MASTSTGTTPKECQQDQTKERRSMKTSSENTTTTCSGIKVEQGVMNIKVEEVNEENICSSDGFTTPKGKIFRITKVDYEDCPPAPMQRKSVMLDSPPSKEVFVSTEIDELFLSTIKQFGNPLKNFARSSMASTPKKCQNNIEETKQNKSMKRSPECASTSPSPKVQQGVTNINVEDVDDENICSSDGITTPKGRRFKIPKVHYDDCPPAPMQRK